MQTSVWYQTETDDYFHHKETKIGIFTVTWTDSFNNNDSLLTDGVKTTRLIQTDRQVTRLRLCLAAAAAAANNYNCIKQEKYFSLEGLILSPSIIIAGSHGRDD